MRAKRVAAQNQFALRLHRLYGFHIGSSHLLDAGVGLLVSIDTPRLQSIERLASIQSSRQGLKAKDRSFSTRYTEEMPGCRARIERYQRRPGASTDVSARECRLFRGQREL